MAQPASSNLPLPDTFISPFLLEVFASVLGFPVDWLIPSKELLPHTVGEVFFRTSSFKHPAVLLGVQHI